MTTTKEFTVSFWGSHPDEDNDDCFTGEDFADASEAIEAFQKECLDRDVMYVELDGPGIHQIRKNPRGRKRNRDREDERSERAMQAGMGLGVEAYNDEMGW